MVAGVKQAAPVPAPDFAARILAAQETLARAEQVAGLTDDPMLPVLAAQSAFVGVVHKVVEEVREAAGTGARGLTPRGEDELIHRVSDRAAHEAGRALGTMEGTFKLRSFAWGLVACVAVLAAGVGGTVIAMQWGDRQKALRIEGAAFMAQIAEVNDASTLRDYCFTHGTDQSGDTWLKCSLPDVWVRAPQSQTKKAAAR